MTQYRYRIVFPDKHTEDIIMKPDENNFIKDVLSDRFEELTGERLTSNALSLHSLGYKLLYIGSEEVT